MSCQGLPKVCRLASDKQVVFVQDFFLGQLSILEEQGRAKNNMTVSCDYNRKDVWRGKYTKHQTVVPHREPQTDKQCKHVHWVVFEVFFQLIANDYGVKIWK